MKAIWSALIVVALGAAYMAIDVAGNYNGNITGLFYTGPAVPLPPALEAHTYRVKDEKGYDAQYYHVIAHDPFNRAESTQYLDNPLVRWRRIGVPALAALFSFGSFNGVDWAYIAVQLVFAFLGAYWLGRYAFAFLLIPGVLVSFDRMTVDLVLAALTIGFIHYRKPYAILAFAPLVRETGFILILSWCLWNALNSRWKDAIIGAVCAIPTLAWWLYVAAHTPKDGTPWLTPIPFSGLIARTINGDTGPMTTLWLRLAHYTEGVALLGIWLAVACGFYLVWQRRYQLIEITIIAFVAFDSLLGRYDIWDTAYAVGRTMSPLLLLLFILGMRDRKPVYALPMLLILPRIALQYEGQLATAIRHLS